MALLATVFFSSTATGQDEDDEESWRDIFDAISVNHEFSTRWWKVEEFYDMVHRSYVTDAHGELQFGLQLDAVVALPRDKANLFSPDAPPTSFRSGVVEPEKIFVRWNPGNGSVRLEAGDFYRAFGRGIALSMNRNVDIDVDTTVLGAGIDAEVGPFRFDGFGGVSNPQSVSLQFPNNIDIDVRDRILGLRTVVDAGPVTLGAHGVRFEWDDGPPGLVLALNNERDIRHRRIDVQETLIAGVHASTADLLGFIDLYVEVDGVRYRGEDVFLVPAESKELDGHAAYGSLTTYVGPMTFQLEAKSYREFEQVNLRSGLTTGQFEYATPPTLEYELVATANSQHAIDSTHITGTRLSAAYGMDRLTFRGSYAFYQDLGGLDILANGTVQQNLNENINAVTAGAEYRGQGGNYYQITVGGRAESRLHEPDVFDQLFHADGDALIALGADRSLEAKAIVYRELVWQDSENPDFRQTFDKRELIVGFRPWTFIGFTVLYDYNTDPLASGGPLVQGTEGNLADNHYIAGEIDVRPMPNSVIRVFFGAASGGLKCSGGTCRVLPPFEGARLEGALRF